MPIYDDEIYKQWVACRYYRPHQPEYSKFENGTLIAYEPGLLFCPFSGCAWARAHRRSYGSNAPEYAKLLSEIYFYGQNYYSGHGNRRFCDPDFHASLWNRAVDLALEWKGNPSFKFARTPEVSKLKDRFEPIIRKWQHAKYDDEYHLGPFLEGIGRHPDRHDIRSHAVASVSRHVRRHRARLSPDSLRFFQMFAGASAISKTKPRHAHATN